MEKFGLYTCLGSLGLLASLGLSEEFISFVWEPGGSMALKVSLHDKSLHHSVFLGRFSLVAVTQVADWFAITAYAFLSYIPYY